MYKCNKAVKKTAQIFCLKWYTVMMMTMTMTTMMMMTFIWVDPVQTWCEWTTWGTHLLISTTLDWTWRTVTHTYCFYLLLNCDGNRRKGFLTYPFENNIEWAALSEFWGLNINTNKSELTKWFFPSYWNFTLKILDSSVFLARLLEVNEKRKLIN